MKKKLLVIMLTVGVCLGIVGCDYSKAERVNSEESNEIPSMFVVVESNNIDGIDGLVCYHRSTKVIYWVSDFGYNRGSLTVLLNPDGSPMVYGEDFHEEG